MSLPFHRPLLLLLLLLLGSNAMASHHDDPTTAKRGIWGFHAGPIPNCSMYHDMEGTASQPETVASVGSETAARPPTPVTTAWDLSSQALPRLQPERSAFATDAPFLNHSAAATTTLLPNHGSSVAAARPSPPIQAGGAGLVVSDGEHGMHQLARLLTSLGYNEMASAAPLLANSPPPARWAITVFAAPDLSLQASCSMCSRRHLVPEHIVVGYYAYPYAELAANPTVKITLASIGFCTKVVSERSPLGTNCVRVYVDGVEVSHLEHSDGSYVVHGLHGFLRHHLTTRSVTTSSGSAASVVRIMIHDEGYGFMALDMRVKFAELESFPNLTVFAFDDKVTLVNGGHDYISAVGFHIAAGSSPDVFRINYTPITEADVFANAGLAVDFIYAQFPDLHGWLSDADGAAGDTPKDDAASTLLWSMAFVPAFLIPLGNYFFGRKTFCSYVEFNGRVYQVCTSCRARPLNWICSCCQLCLCCQCFADVFLRRHSSDLSDRPCEALGAIGELIENNPIIFEKNNNYYKSSEIEVEAEQVPYKSVDPVAKIQLQVFTNWRDLFPRYPPQRTLKITITEHNGRIFRWRKVYLAPKQYTSTKTPLVMKWLGWDD